MAFDLSTLSSTSSNAAGLSGLILATPKATVGYQPQNAPSFKKDTNVQRPSLVFNYEGENVSTLKSDITDHYVEDNTAIQDQVALKPVIVKTEGFVGELNNIPPAALRALKEVADKLTPIPGLAPSLSETAELQYAKAFQTYQIAKNLANAAVGAWSSINGLVNGGGVENVINGSTEFLPPNPNQTQQQVYYSQFYGYWKTRTLFTVQTPWAVFQDMIIDELISTQDAETRTLSTFKVTFKQMRFASTLAQTIALYDNTSFQGRLLSQGSSQVDLGISTLEQSSTSFDTALTTMRTG